jgi:Rieske Fe-S protein
VRRREGGVEVFSSICPHLGCSVDFRAAQRDFFCPCHTSTFDLQGRRLNRIPPRNMDALEVRVEQDRIWIRYQRFRGGIPEKVAI